MSAHTAGPLELAIWDEAKDPVEMFREQISYGSGPIWGVWAPRHPLTRGEHPRPEHAVMTCLTGNGPSSEANANLYAAAPDLLAALVMLAGVVGEQEVGPVDDGSIYALAMAHAAIAKAMTPLLVIERPKLRLWKGEPVVILGDAKAAAIKADWSLARWEEFSKTARACLKPECLPEEMELFLAVVRERFETSEAPGFTLNTKRATE